MFQLLLQGLMRLIRKILFQLFGVEMTLSDVIFRKRLKTHLLDLA